MTVRLAAAAIGWLVLGAASARADAPPPSATASAHPAVITNPDWDQRPNGDDLANVYPPRARAVGVRGKTEIQCRVAVDGGLEDCTVLYETPVGWGFGEAAMEIAPRFRMKPKLVNGQPVATGTVRIPISWQVEGAKPAILYTPGPDDLALARRLQKALHTNLASGLLANFYGADVAPAIARMDAERGSRLSAAWKSASARLRDGLAEREAQAWAQVYSRQELGDMVAFFESNSGQAFLLRGQDVWPLANADTRGPFLAFVDAWRDAYCADTTCDAAEQALFDKVREQGESLPGPH